MAPYSEEVAPLEVGYGLYTAELAASIPPGYCSRAYNVIGLGDSMENRLGLQYSSVDYKKQMTMVPDHYFLTILYKDDPAFPVLGWPEGNNLNFVRASNRFGGAITGNNYMQINYESSPIGSMCQYGNITYFSTNVGIRKITAYNWTTPAITAASVTTGVTGLHGMFAFKDRVWGFKGDQIYFTNVATVTVNPETWSATTQAIPVKGLGRGEIKKIVPIGNRLLIFTTNGLWALNVQGEPASWVLKILDSTSQVTHECCAFERKGLVYYVDRAGVNVTDGYEVTALSSSISDKFIRVVGTVDTLRHSLNFLDEGMVLSIWIEYKSGASTYIKNSLFTVFYSRLDIIAWTEWTPRDMTGLGFGGQSNFDDQDTVITVTSTSDVVYTAFGNDPFQFILMTTTRGTVTDDEATFQLCIYDDTEDSLWTGPVSGGALATEMLKLSVTSGYTDLGAPHKTKYLKYAYLEMFATNLFNIYTAWSFDFIDASDAENNRGLFQQQLPQGVATNLIKVPADFYCRRVALSIHSFFSLDSMKWKNVALIYHTGRNEARDTS